MRTQRPRNTPYYRMLREYNFLARYYDRIWAFYIRATTRRSLAQLAAPAAGRVLDVGCGTGEMLRELRLTRPALRLAGIDPSDKMLALSREKLGNTVDLRAAYAEALPFEDSSFDAVISNSVFHYIRQPEDALAAMKRVLVPGGQLLITDWCSDYMLCRICDTILRNLEGAHVHAYSEAQLRTLVCKAGFMDVKSERYKISWLWGMMTVTARRPTVLPRP